MTTDLALTKKERDILTKAQKAGLSLSKEDLKVIAPKLNSRPSVAQIKLAIGQFLESRSTAQINEIRTIFGDLQLEARRHQEDVEAELGFGLENFSKTMNELDQDFKSKIDNIIDLFKTDESA
ncbi:MAG: hypothetical protein ACO3YZ_05075 [Candidatus Nanopelagicaceae bacterium]